MVLVPSFIEIYSVDQKEVKVMQQSHKPTYKFSK
jgi:hypothetical protein